MSFLKAEWRKLIMINYEVHPELLKPYLPKGTMLDTYEEKYYISLIGFMFKNTKLLGVKIPFHVNFEEVNLRFYVKRVKNQKVKRGVVFIKEIVPKSAITFIANTLYNENYETLPMKHFWDKNEDHLEVIYKWKKHHKWNKIQVSANNELKIIPENSIIEFISEHYWGYSKETELKTTEYEVRHPRWKYYPVQDVNIEVDFSTTYGEKFKFLNESKPASIMLLEGSEITIENKLSL